jgi:hypothetical protein
MKHASTTDCSGHATNGKTGELKDFSLKVIITINSNFLSAVCSHFDILGRDIVQSCIIYLTLLLKGQKVVSIPETAQCIRNTQKAAPELQPFLLCSTEGPYIIHRLRIRQPSPGCLLINSTDGHKDRATHYISSRSCGLSTRQLQ